MQNLKLKTFTLGKFYGKINILNTHNLLYQKCAAVCQNSAERCNFPTEFKHTAADFKQMGFLMLKIPT